MSFFRSIVLGALLIVPMISIASTVTSLNAPSPSSPSPASYTGTGQSLVTTPVGPLADTWTLNVGAGEKADIAFTNNNLVAFGVQFFDITGFTVLPSASMTGLTAGVYSFAVTGSSVGFGGGSYLVGTKVSPIPVPAAIWLMGSALVGLVSFSRRKTGMAA